MSILKSEYVIRKNETESREYVVMLRENLLSEDYSVLVFPTSREGIVQQNEVICEKNYKNKWLAKIGFNRIFNQFQRKIDWDEKNYWK